MINTEELLNLSNKNLKYKKKILVAKNYVNDMILEADRINNSVKGEVTTVLLSRLKELMKILEED